jgi:hypothetical protein
VAAAVLAPAGTYAPAGSSAPIPSPAGTYINFSGASSLSDAIEAPMGTYALAGSTSATLVPAGTYDPYIGLTSASAALSAQPGYYVPSRGATAETAASPGFFVPVSGSSVQIPAITGHYVPSTGATAELTASAGYYVPEIGASIQTPASPGYYVPSTGATMELAAAPGYYVAASGATTATASPPGSYVPTTGSSAAIVSPPGYFVADSAAVAPTLDPAGTWSMAGAAAATPLILSSINLSYGQALNASQLSGNVPAAGSYSFTSETGAVLSAGNAQQIAVQFTPADPSPFAPVIGSVSVNVLPAVPTVTVTDQGGIFNGHAFPATATVAGIDGTAASALEDVSPSITYYAGSTATGTALTTVPTAMGTYTALAAFAGSKDYSAESSTVTFSILSNANKLVFSGIPTTAVAGAKFGAFQVKFENAYGQLLTTGKDASMQVTIAGISGKSFSARLHHGVATFRTVHAKLVGSYVLTASAKDKTVTTATADVVINPAAAAKLVSTSNRTVQAAMGMLVATPLVYKLEDRFGNVEISDSDSTVTLLSNHSLAANSWSGNTVTAVDGIATFDHLLIDDTGRLVLTAQGNDPATRVASPVVIDLVPASAEPR